jgi:DNA-binding NarL/FixJ family response regulator
MRNITVLVVDDHNIVRQGLRALLLAEGDITIVGEAQSGREAVQMAAQLRPEIVIMDLAMPLLNGAEATRQILKEVPTSRIVVLSSYGDDEHVQAAIASGAAAYLLKQTAAVDLVKAIREVTQGNAYFSPTIARRLREKTCPPEVDATTPLPGTAEPVQPTDLPQPAVELTSREMEVLQLIAEGFANKQIAAELGLSVKTIEKHRQAVMKKLNIHDIAGLVHHAVKKGIIELKMAGVPSATDTPGT